MNIYVGNVPYKATEEDLKELFEPHGPLTSVAIIRDRRDGRSKGYGFVEMENQDEAEKAVEALDGQEMMGRPLKVNPARSQDQRTGGQPTSQNQQSSRKRQTRTQQPYTTSDSDGEFHNPYTFVPTPPRDEIDADKFAGDFNPLEHPCGKEYNLDHATLKDDLWTGHIPIKLTTVTPLVLLKDDGRERKATDPQKYDVHDRIPESSLRGMLRSAYETVTNSRYACFGRDHEKRLAYRMDTREALQLVPTIIKKDKTTEKLTACFYNGTTLPKQNGPKKPRKEKGKNIGTDEATDNAMYAAMLTCYKPGTVKTLLEGDYKKPKTGDKVFAVIVLCEKYRYLYWKAIRIGLIGQIEDKHKLEKTIPDTWENEPLFTDQNGEHVVKVVEGTVFVSNESIDMKHDERIFFLENTKSQQFKKVNDNIIKGWKQLIQNYRDVHTDDDIFKRKDKDGKVRKPWEWFYKKDSTKEYACSPHLYHRDNKQDRWGRKVEDALDLKEGDMVYARCKIDDNTGRIKSIKDLFPVMISRELYECSPKELLPESLQPAKKLNELSPADRLFGWTPQSEGSDSGYKSRIRVVCNDSERSDTLEEFENDPLPLSILGEPKPEQGRFYVAADDKGTPQNKVQNKKDAGYDKKSNKQLRGRKQYWHHKGLEPKNAPNYWKSPAEDRTQKKTDGRFQEYRRPDKYDNQTQQMKKQTDTQNRSIKGWIKPNTQFTASLYVQNLQPAEVGALLWLLTLSDDQYFRFGYGKPLGFGSVKIEIDTECLQLGTGKDWKEYYEDLYASPPATLDIDGREKCIQEFKDSMKQAYKGQDFDKLPFIEGFLQVLQGPNSDNPRIHYPRSEPKRDPEGNNFKWFMDNDHHRDGKKLALPKVTGKKGLPYKAKD